MKTSVGEVLGKKEPSFTADGNVHWYSHYGKQYGGISKIKNSPATLFLGIYPKELKTFICKDICTPMFTAALFMVAKTWEQQKCPSVDDWIKKMWDVYTMKWNTIQL